jgi:SNF2 family DNA or RNA helicase
MFVPWQERGPNRKAEHFRVNILSSSHVIFPIPRPNRVVKNENNNLETPKTTIHNSLSDLTMDARPSNPSPSLLEQVVPKLRPFQREALEFATKGKLYDRQRAGTSTGTENGQPMTSSQQTTGRCVASTTKENSTKLLLADEMGLGKVRKLQL